jgi:hypothetical protein
MPMRRFPAVVAFVLVSTTAFADPFPAKTGCFQPQKPNAGDDRTIDAYRTGNFHDAVQTYRYCIEDFISDQRKQLRKHREAIDAATEEWEEFVKRVQE